MLCNIWVLDKNFMWQLKLVSPSTLYHREDKQLKRVHLHVWESFSDRDSPKNTYADNAARLSQYDASKSKIEHEGSNPRCWDQLRRHRAICE